VFAVYCKNFYYITVKPDKKSFEDYQNTKLSRLTRTLTTIETDRSRHLEGNSLPIGCKNKQCNKTTTRFKYERLTINAIIHN